MNSVFQPKAGAPVDLSALPPDALLTRRQLSEVTGFGVQTFKNWAAHGRGPKIVRVENRPRHRVRDVRQWMGLGNA